MAAKHDLFITQGKTFTRAFILKDASGVSLDLTGWTIRGQIRKTYDAAAKVDLVCTIDTSPTSGKFVVSLTATATAGIAVDPAMGPNKAATKYVYDIEAVRADATVIDVVEGQALIWPEVTR